MDWRHRHNFSEAAGSNVWEVGKYIGVTTLFSVFSGRFYKKGLAKQTHLFLHIVVIFCLSLSYSCSLEFDS